MKNQRYGLPVLADPLKVQELKDKFNDFKSWAMVGEGRDVSGYFISTTKFMEMIKGNEGLDGFKICFGMKDDAIGDTPSTQRSMQIILTAIKFTDGQEDDGMLHQEITAYSSLPPRGVEPPVLKCPPLDCTIVVEELAPQ